MDNKKNSTQYLYLEGRKVGIIGVSIKEGQDLEGPEVAPDHLRKAGLHEVINSLDWEYQDYLNIEDNNLKIDTGNVDEYKYKNLKHSLKIGAACKNLYSYVRKMAEAGQFSLILGGDHGIATGSISALKSVYPDLKIIWIDAHADCNIPEESPSGNYHGMPVAHLFGWIEQNTVPGFDWFKPCLKKEDFVFIGLRSIDKGERVSLKKHGIKYYTMHEVTKYGIGAVLKEAVEYLSKDEKNSPIHLSFDIDAIDPAFAYGTGTRARGGLSYREALYIVKEVADSGRLVGLDLVEINPLIDRPREHFHGDSQFIKEASETVSLGLELIGCALGEKFI